MVYDFRSFLGRVRGGKNRQKLSKMKFQRPLVIFLKINAVSIKYPGNAFGLVNTPIESIPQDYDDGGILGQATENGIVPMPPPIVVHYFFTRRQLI